MALAAKGVGAHWRARTTARRLSRLRDADEPARAHSGRGRMSGRTRLLRSLDDPFPRRRRPGSARPPGRRTGRGCMGLAPAGPGHSPVRVPRLGAVRAGSAPGHRHPGAAGHPGRGRRAGHRDLRWSTRPVRPDGERRNRPGRVAHVVPSSLQDLGCRRPGGSPRPGHRRLGHIRQPLDLGCPSPSRRPGSGPVSGSARLPSRCRGHGLPADRARRAPRAAADPAFHRAAPCAGARACAIRPRAGHRGRRPCGARSLPRRTGPAACRQ